MRADSFLGQLVRALARREVPPPQAGRRAPGTAAGRLVVALRGATGSLAEPFADRPPTQHGVESDDDRSGWHRVPNHVFQGFGASADVVRRSPPRLAFRVAALVVTVTVVGAFSWQIIRNGLGVADAGCPATVRVVAASSIAPVVSAAARILRHEQNCIAVEVTSVDGRAAVKAASQDRADVWIPDDAAWAGLAPPNLLAAEGDVDAYATLALSPVYMVTDKDTAARIETTGGTWHALADLVANRSSRVTLVVRNPGGSGDGLVAAGALNEAVWLADGMDAATKALAAILASTRTVDDDVAAMPEAPGQVGLVPEYALLPTMPLAPAGRVYLAARDHAAVLRYTWLPTATAADDPKRAAALRRLRAAFDSSEVRAALSAAGLRAPDGGRLNAEGADALPQSSVSPFDVYPPHHVRHILVTWSVPDRRSNLLVIADIVEPAGLQSLDLLNQGCRQLVNLIPSDSRVGLWEAATDGRDHHALVPLGTMDDNARQTFALSVAKLVVRPPGSPLTGAIVAGYRSLRDDHRDDMVNQLLVVIDGAGDSNIPPSAIPELLRLLAAEREPQRSVTVTVIVLRNEGLATSLGDALRPIGAYVHNATTADDFEAAFIHVLAGKLVG
jgi:hypothetical protein